MKNADSWRGFVTEKLYQKIRESVPIVCVDLVIKTENGVLLGMRDHEPVKDALWLIGGRVNFGETLEHAALRKAHEETGLKIKIEKLIGIYTLRFTKGEVRHNIAIDFLVRKIGGKLQLTKEYSKFIFIKKLDERLHPYVRCVLNDSLVFKRGSYAAYKTQPFFVD